MALPSKTPAMTARKDLLKHSPKKLRANRYKEVDKRSREIMRELAAQEGLFEKWNDPSQRAAVMARVYELLEVGKQQAEQEIPQVEQDQEARLIYHRAKLLKGKMNVWRSTGKAAFEAELSESAEKARELAEDLRELITFIKEAKPSIAEYTNEEGKTEFDDSDVRRTFYDSGAIVAVKEADAYRSIVNAFDMFVSKLSHSLDEVEEELEAYEEDPVGDIIDTAEDLGLVQVYEDSDDGCLWFQDEETGQLYFFILVGQKLDVRTMYSAEHVRDDNWKAQWATYLNYNVIAGHKASVYDTPSRVFRDYFGVWNGIRPYVKQSVKRGNSIPDCMPADYVNSKIN